MAGRLEGKVVFISGGARGQGAAEGQLFAREGAKVVLGDVLDDDGNHTVASITAAGGAAMYVHLDVTREADWKKAIVATQDEFGQLNVLVNNAGILRNEGVEKTTLDVWNLVIAVNQTGTFLGMKAALPGLRQAGGGSIINISSVAGLVGTGAAAAYQATKGAVRLLTKTAAVEYARDNIRINSIHPGVIATAMVAESFSPRARQRYEKTIPLGREGTAEEIAQGALFLASDESSYMTGAELVLDGGYTAQ